MDLVGLGPLTAFVADVVASARTPSSSSSPRRRIIACDVYRGPIFSDFQRLESRLCVHLEFGEIIDYFAEVCESDIIEIVKANEA